jgi:hypothetical protein
LVPSMGITNQRHTVPRDTLSKLGSAALTTKDSPARCLDGDRSGLKVTAASSFASFSTRSCSCTSQEAANHNPASDTAWFEFCWVWMNVSCACLWGTSSSPTTGQATAAAIHARAVSSTYQSDLASEPVSLAHFLERARLHCCSLGSDSRLEGVLIRGPPTPAACAVAAPAAATGTGLASAPGSRGFRDTRAAAAAACT